MNDFAYSDAFVARVNVSGNALEYCGYIGGEKYDRGFGVAVDADGHAYVTGETRSDEATFPVLIGPDLTYNDTIHQDAFVAKVTSNGDSLVYCGYIGGINRDIGKGIAIDSNNSAYITGHTYSDETTFPVKGGPDSTFNDTDEPDAFVAGIKPDGTALTYCGYIGGSDDDYARGIAVGADGSVYVAGDTKSDESAENFPVKRGPDTTYFGNNYSDAFVAKIKMPSSVSTFELLLLSGE